MQIVLPFSEGNENVMKIFKGHHGWIDGMYGG